MYELWQNRIGATLWQRPDLYIKNSAVLKADRVTTPLLMMETKNDGICPFGNAVEFFTALRRLGKKVWMLQYDDGNHAVWGKSASDFSVRMAQFFDHYPKGAPAPVWMTEGIPARQKGIEDGLDLDHSGKEP
jgi:dipeptidyl aminopeptidase/acylaminoacyl peptidase